MIKKNTCTQRSVPRRIVRMAKSPTAESPYGEVGLLRNVPTPKCPYDEVYHSKMSHSQVSYGEKSKSPHILLVYLCIL